MSKSLELARTFLGKTVRLEIDAPIGSSYAPNNIDYYPVNYGSVPGVKAPDGDDLDAYYLGTDQPLETVEGVCIAIVHRPNDDDDNLVVVPDGVSFTDQAILAQVWFQEEPHGSVVVRS